jgi:hypothetical protein
MDELNYKFKTLGDGIANPAQRAPFHTYSNIVEHPNERGTSRRAGIFMVNLRRLKVHIIFER